LKNKHVEDIIYLTTGQGFEPLRLHWNQ